jgi:hypothetical protein
MMHIDTSSRSEQRKFGLVMAVAIAALGVLRWAIHGFAHFPLYFFVVAAVFAGLGLLFPRALKPVFVVWMKFAEGMNWVMTRLLLGIAFYVMITPTRLLIRLFGEDPLKRDWHPDADTYWEDAEEQPAELERYLNQF